jgi:predicted nucleotidyltransferase
VTTLIDRVLDHCDRSDPGGVSGIYLCGSATMEGLRPDSDIDLLLITRRSLGAQERRQLTDLLLRYSGRRATVTADRPVELTSVVRASLAQWTYPPTCDYQYGEWLRDTVTAGEVPAPHADPDLAVVLASAISTSEALRGPPLNHLVAGVPATDVRRAVHDCLPALLADLRGDERNVLLTLARMIVTLQSGEIVGKDRAARHVCAGLPAPHAAVLELARQGYVGETLDDWTVLDEQAGSTAELLAARIREL